MKSLRFFDRRAGYSIVSIGLLLGMVAPGIVPAFASAAQLSSRSIELSSTIVSATSVSYTLTFTPVSNAAAFVVDFCDDSPLAGQTCTAPTGFSAAGVGSTTSGATATDLNLNSTHSTVKVVYAMTGGTPATVELTGLTNPSYTTDGTAHHGFYARVITYAAAGDTANYTTGATPTEGSGATDDGGLAMAITQAIGVSAAVRETMTFCVSGAAPSSDCLASSITAPTLTLGTGSPAALDAAQVSSGTVYTQISTNAATGAIVRMTNNNSCGGLKRAGTSTCDIAPQTTDPASSGDVIAGSALFGVQVGTAASASGATSPSGTIGIASGTKYSTSKYYMNYVAGGASGVTSTYGDPLLDTAGAPVSNKNIGLTFGASISNTTPAGLYTSNLNLIATGTF